MSTTTRNKRRIIDDDEEDDDDDVIFIECRPAAPAPVLENEDVGFMHAVILQPDDEGTRIRRRIPVTIQGIPARHCEKKPMQGRRKLQKKQRLVPSDFIYRGSGTIEPDADDPFQHAMGTDRRHLFTPEEAQAALEQIRDATRIGANLFVYIKERLQQFLRGVCTMICAIEGISYFDLYLMNYEQRATLYYNFVRCYLVQECGFAAGLPNYVPVIHLHEFVWQFQNENSKQDDERAKKAFRARHEIAGGHVLTVGKDVSLCSSPGQHEDHSCILCFKEFVTEEEEGDEDGEIDCDGCQIPLGCANQQCQVMFHSRCLLKLRKHHAKNKEKHVCPVCKSGFSTFYGVLPHERL